MLPSPKAEPVSKGKGCLLLSPSSPAAAVCCAVHIMSSKLPFPSLEVATHTDMKHPPRARSVAACGPCQPIVKVLTRSWEVWMASDARGASKHPRDDGTSNGKGYEARPTFVFPIILGLHLRARM